MNNFSYTRAASPEEALEELREGGDTRVLAGGTDLIPLLKEEIVSATRLVDLSGWSGGSEIASGEEGLKIGALTPLSEIENSPEVRRSYPALAEACGSAASPQLRNMGTIGGNLLQQTRCWYYRGAHQCWLKGGTVCFAREGENEHHAIFLNRSTESHCVSAHPSDPAPALLALGASVSLKGPDGDSRVLVEEFFALPDDRRRNFVKLPEGTLITGVLLPPAVEGARSVYLKAMPRASWAFALASLALYTEIEESKLGKVRMALGGVAPVPFRAKAVESAMTGVDPSKLDALELGNLLVEGARPLSNNRYKVRLLRGLLAEAVSGLSLSVASS